MFDFICMYIPAVITVAIYDRLSGNKLKGRGGLYLYALSNALINLICWVILRTKSGIMYFDLRSADTAIRYLAIACAAAAAVGVGAVLLDKNVKVVLEHDEKV